MDWKLRSKRALWLVVLAIAAIGAFAAFGVNRKSEAQYFTTKVERGEVAQVVEATGTINAVTTVQVGSQVSGTIAALHADFNSQVKKGQVVAQIDPSIFSGNLLQAQADLENARANLAATRANLEKSRASAEQMKAEYQRAVELARQGITSQQQLDVAKANSESAVASVNASLAQERQAVAQVSQRAAAVQVAQTNLNHTTIKAPIDGTVVARNVDVGQTVAASLQAPTLFTIAQDLTKMQVYAKTDESDVGLIKVGQPVSFKVDAFPRETFHGKVVQVRMNATAVQNVVTYDTVVEFANPERKLFPGMTAYVSIPVAVAQDALRIPNAALRYKPDMTAEEQRAAYERAGVKMGRGQRAEAAGGSGGGSAAGERPARGQGQNRGQQQAASAEGSAPAAPAQPREARADMGVVWKLGADKQLLPVQVRTGITDYTQTEVVRVIAGELKEGDQLVTGTMAARRAASGAAFGGAAGGGRGGR